MNCMRFARRVLLLERPLKRSSKSLGPFLAGISVTNSKLSRLSSSGLTGLRTGLRWIGGRKKSLAKADPGLGSAVMGGFETAGVGTGFAGGKSALEGSFGVLHAISSFFSVEIGAVSVGTGAGSGVWRTGLVSVLTRGRGVCVFSFSPI